MYVLWMNNKYNVKCTGGGVGNDRYSQLIYLECLASHCLRHAAEISKLNDEEQRLLHQLCDIGQFYQRVYCAQ